MSNNYIQNLNIIKNDYYKCIGTWENCKTIYKEISKISNNIKENTEEYYIYKSQIEDLLSNLGKVGEKSLKYIIGLEYIERNPNADSNSLNNLFKKTKTLKDFITRHGIQENDERLTKITKYDDINNQKAHNFDYWYTALELSMPHIINDINELFYNLLQSESVYKKYKNSLIEEYDNDYKLAPNTYNKITTNLFTIICPDILSGLTNKQVKYYGGIKKNISKRELENKRNKIKECGDAFTRYRYASNNPDNQTFPLNDLIKIISVFVLYITFIHNNNNNLNIDININYAKYQCINHKDILNSSEQDIIKVFNYYISNSFELVEILFSKFTFQEISRIIDLGVSKNNFINIIEKSKLNSGIIKHYKSIGITDYQQMEELYEEYLNNSQYTSQKPKLKTRI